MSDTARQFFEAQSTALSACFRNNHKVDEAAHIDYEEFLFTCRTCSKDYAVISERVYLTTDEDER